MSPRRFQCLSSPAWCLSKRIFISRRFPAGRAMQFETVECRPLAKAYTIPCEMGPFPSIYVGVRRHEGLAGDKRDGILMAGDHIIHREERRFSGYPPIPRNFAMSRYCTGDIERRGSGIRRAGFVVSCDKIYGVGGFA